MAIEISQFFYTNYMAMVNFNQAIQIAQMAVLEKCLVMYTPGMHGYAHAGQSLKGQEGENY